MGIMQHLRLVMPTARPARPWPSSGTWADGNGSGPALSSPGLAQGGSRIKKECLGSNFLVKPSMLDLPTYVIRHMSIYGNMTSSL